MAEGCGRRVEASDMQSRIPRLLGIFHLHQAAGTILHLVHNCLDHHWVDHLGIGHTGEIRMAILWAIQLGIATWLPCSQRRQSRAEKGIEDMRRTEATIHRLVRAASL